MTAGLYRTRAAIRIYARDRLTVDHAIGASALVNRVSLDGEWDLARKDELRSLFGDLDTENAATIDLSRCTYADSTILAALALLRMKFAEVPITLVGPSRQLRHLFNLTQFDRLFRIVEEG